VPASNMKLFTTALALAKLGPEYRFTRRWRRAARFRAMECWVETSRLWDMAIESIEPKIPL